MRGFFDDAKKVSDEPTFLEIFEWSLFDVCLFLPDATAGNGFVEPGDFLFGIRMKIAENRLVCHFHRRQIWHELFIDEGHKRFLERGRAVCLYRIRRRVFVAHPVEGVLRLTDLRKDSRYAVKCLGGLFASSLSKSASRLSMRDDSAA